MNSINLLSILFIILGIIIYFYLVKKNHNGYDLDLSRVYMSSKPSNVSKPQTKFLGMDNRKFSGSVEGSQIFLIKPHKRDLSKIWSTAQLVIKSERPCRVKEGINLTSYEENSDKFTIVSKFLSKLKSFQELSDYNCQSFLFLPLFDNYTIEVEIDGYLEVEYQFTYVDSRLVILCLLGILLFYSSNKLSRNEIFQYFSGTSIGVIGSVLVLLILIVRVIPKKSTAAMAFLSGSSFFLFLMRWLYLNFKNLTESFQLYIIAYIGLSALISGAYCYYRGPISNDRGINIINFTLKILSIVLIYLGSSNTKFSISLVISFFIVNIAYKYKNIGNITIFKNIKNKYFPEKRRMLTQDEYIKEGQEYTLKALNELKDFCNSPQCDAWKTISKIKNPSKFAKFINSESFHLDDDELFDYENYSMSNDLIDDDDD